MQELPSSGAKEQMGCDIMAALEITADSYWSNHPRPVAEGSVNLMFIWRGIEFHITMAQDALEGRIPRPRFEQVGSVESDAKELLSESVSETPSLTEMVLDGMDAQMRYLGALKQKGVDLRTVLRVQYMGPDDSSDD